MFNIKNFKGRKLAIIVLKNNFKLTYCKTYFEIN